MVLFITDKLGCSFSRVNVQPKMRGIPDPREK